MIAECQARLVMELPMEESNPRYDPASRGLQKIRDPDLPVLCYLVFLYLFIYSIEYRPLNEPMPGPKPWRKNSEGGNITLTY